MNSHFPVFGLNKPVAFIVTVIFLLPVSIMAAAAPSRLPDEPIPLATEGMDRTPPLIEAFEPFLSTGDISPGFEVPGGAIWQPQLLVWGDYRTALQTYDNGAATTEEWANRLNLFAQLRLTGTERFVMSMRPLDEDGVFSGYRFSPEDGTEGSVDATNSTVTTFFFEGDFGELFPNLDPDESRKLDWGFALGRQPVFKQEGMLINDNIDAIGIVRNSITAPGASNIRVAGLYGWNQINRNDRTEDPDASLFGVFTEIDTRCCTIDADFVFVSTDDPAGDGFFMGLSSVQRLGHLNTSFRFLLSSADETDSVTVSSGSLLFAETAYTPTATDNNLYINGFVGLDQFSPAARNAGEPGPLARTGILFAGVGLGSYGSALNSNAGEVVGGAVGYQMFFSGGRKQFIVEAGLRNETEGLKSNSAAVGARFQQALGRHTIYILDGFVADDDIVGDTRGARAELRFKF